MTESAAVSRFFWGVDCGSSAIKVVVCDECGNVLEKRKTKTLFPLEEHVSKVLSEGTTSPFEAGSHTIRANHFLAITGYGRRSVSYAQSKLTEIKAHFLGVKSQLDATQACTIVDIGGQDSKIITLTNGNIDQFTINRKCAAGTGSFIEEIAHRLELNLAELATIARKHDKSLKLNSYCTVFAGQEVIRFLMNGEKVENLIYALYRSVVQRIREMAPIPSQRVIFSGGVIQYHPILLELFQDAYPDKKLSVAADAQYAGALGAALYAISLR